LTRIKKHAGGALSATPAKARRYWPLASTLQVTVKVPDVLALKVGIVTPELPVKVAMFKVVGQTNPVLELLAHDTLVQDRPLSGISFNTELGALPGPLLLTTNE